MTIRQAIDEISKLGYPVAAKWLVKSVLDLDESDLILSADNEILPIYEDKIKNIFVRLSENEPVQYIIGSWQFIDIEVKTDKRALIPRPETELLAVKTLEYSQNIDEPVIVDLGCGTGCIGLYLKHKQPKAQVTLVDISDDALELARENAKALKLKCNFIKENILVVEKITCDIMVSNPPYIKTDDILALDANVKEYEPHLALDGGKDGLKYYRALAKLAYNSLKKNGVLLLEIGVNQSFEVEDILREYFEEIKKVKDFNGVDRIIVAKRGKHV